ncbi:M23 family metallopeptidase [Methyloraptor flagellatus]|uniref:M23 family metallopeptidase n=1 Tax=Methyloraptor flagellatus TaxID=3162530 RepID=UPI00387DC2C7
MALHTGLDLRAPEGEPVHATAAGTVTDAGRQGGYGIMVEIDHGNGVSTRFGHLSRVAVADGQKVATGDIIGYAGSTGRSTGPHLHYETRVNGEPLDPEPWLEAGRRLRAVFAR